MKLNELRPTPGSRKGRKRVGRGPGSGLRKTAGRGHNGALSRSGAKKRIGFEGGQMPLQKRVPKFGFKNPTRKERIGINLSTLQKLAEEKGVETISPEVLKEHGVVSKMMPVKILGNGELKQKVTVQAHGFSASAKKAIEDQGGRAENL
jgi:large subunit ribosomal protein L15